MIVCVLYVRVCVFTLGLVLWPPGDVLLLLPPLLSDCSSSSVVNLWTITSCWSCCCWWSKGSKAQSMIGRRAAVAAQVASGSSSADSTSPTSCFRGFLPVLCVLRLHKEAVCVCVCSHSFIGALEGNEREAEEQVCCCQEGQCDTTRWDAAAVTKQRACVCVCSFTSLEGIRTTAVTHGIVIVPRSLSTVLISIGLFLLLLLLLQNQIGHQSINLPINHSFFLSFL